MRDVGVSMRTCVVHAWGYAANAQRFREIYGGLQTPGIKQALKSGLLLARSQPPIFFLCIILSCHTSVSAPNVDIGFIC